MFDDLKKVELVLNQRDEALAIIKRIQDALGTQETGEALIEVASNAHKAEMELASTYNFGSFDDMVDL